MGSRGISVVFTGRRATRRQRLERELITAASRLEELGAAAFIGWIPSPETQDAILKEFQKLNEAVRLLRAEGAIT